MSNTFDFTDGPEFSGQYEPFPKAEVLPQKNEARRARIWRALRLTFSVPLLAGLCYGLYQWSLFLMLAIYTSDRWNYVRYHLNGATDAMSDTEPLWRLIAPAIGDMFPRYPYEAISMATLGLVLLGMRLNRFPWFLVVVLAFSPGITYFLVGALRQGFAQGIFLVLLSIYKRSSPDGDKLLRWWVVVAASIPAILIHNAMIVATIYLLSSLWILRDSQSARRSQLYQALLAAISLAMIYSVQEPGTTALIVVTVQVACFLGSIFYRPLRAPRVPMLSIFLAIVAAGFLFTTSGIRVVLALGLIVPLVLPRHGKWIAIFSCVIYPFLQFGILPGWGYELNRRNGVTISE